MPYSVGHVLGTVCLDGYCLINNVFILFIYSYSVHLKRLAMLFLKVSKLQNKYAAWPRKKEAVIIAITMSTANQLS